MSMIPYHSQIGQDQLLDRHVFRGMRDGVFVDIGAHDGETFSNSLAFEEGRGWTGLCVEPNPEVFPRLAARRRATCLNIAVADRDGTLRFTHVVGGAEMLSGLADHADPDHGARIAAEIATRGGEIREIAVEARRPDPLFAEHGLREIHLLSIDTEGGEAAILAAIDHDAVRIHVVDVECDGPGDVAAVRRALGPRFAFAGRHRFDAFFLNRESPVFARRWALRRAIWTAALARMLDKLKRRGGRRRNRAARRA